MTANIEVNNHSFSLEQFHSSLRTWDIYHRRIFPWRLTSNPYYLLIAELMLRRTQAQQVIDVYNVFIGKYPDVHSLALAPKEEIARILFPLGLAWRVSAFQQLAQTLIDHYKGEVPADYDTLVTLPGVGDYVASAVCCFAFGQDLPVIDTNTVRIVGRLFGIPTHAESRRRKSVRSLLHMLLDQEHPEAYNYAMLDLAALICTPINPRCSECPLLSYCKTGQEYTYV